MRKAKPNREEVRSTAIVIPVTKAEKSLVENGANAIGISTASYVRMIIRNHFAKK